VSSTDSGALLRYSGVKGSEGLRCRRFATRGATAEKTLLADEPASLKDRKFPFDFNEEKLLAPENDCGRAYSR
jgi:hypothetical protein